MKKIPLTQNQFAMVDDEDYEFLSKRKWYARKHKNGGWYAFTALSMARLIMDEPKGMIVDHKDGNTLNNQKGNLRACTPSENVRNSKLKGAKSGYKGVYETKFHKWMVILRINGKGVNCGHFETKEEAAAAYNHAALLHYGEFARLNVIPK